MVYFSELFKNLKQTLKGKEDFFFLVNDNTEEILQHFSSDFNHTLNVSNFIQNQKSKKEYFNNLGINYGFFLIPDKSVILKDYLPFESNYLFRYVDDLNEVIYDLSHILTVNDFNKTDSIVSKLAHIKIVSYILSVFTEYDYYFYESFFKSALSIEKIKFTGDLLYKKNWSYDFDSTYDKYKNIDEYDVNLNSKIIKVSLNEIPEEFRKFSVFSSKYYINKNSFTNKRVLVLYDTKIEYLVPVLLSYYEEVFCYRDQNLFYEQLIDWFKPDDVIEIRIERYLNKLHLPQKNSLLEKLPLRISVDVSVIKDKLLISSDVTDIHNMPLNSEYVLYIDGNIIKEDSFTNGKISLEFNQNDFSFDYHNLKITIKETNETHPISISKKFSNFEDITKYFDGLVKTLKGKNDTFFLVNDSNNEIRQHFDCYYESFFNPSLFIKSQKSKINYLKKLNIPYRFFVVPDKSIILKDFLPFEIINCNRNVDHINDYVVDLLPYIDVEDYLINDTHISMESSFKVVPLILSHFHGNTPEYYHNLLKQRLQLEKGIVEGNLLRENNWSYDFDDYHSKFKEITTNIVKYPKSSKRIDLKEIPEEYRRCHLRKTIYMVNPNSISDKKALIFHGSSLFNMCPALSEYYREIFCYFDYSYFNKKLVEWYKPDVMFEFRIERFLEKAFCPIVSDVETNLLPISIKIDKMHMKNNILYIKLYGKDLRDMKLSSVCQLFIDDILVSTEKFMAHYCEFNVNISQFSKGEHELRLYNKETNYTKEFELIEKIIFEE